MKSTTGSYVDYNYSDTGYVQNGLAEFLMTHNRYVMADVYTITLSDGTVIRYADADIALVVNGNTFASGPLFRRGRTRCVIGLEVDTLDLTICANDTHLVEGVPLLQAAALGALDGAEVQLERAFFSDWGAALEGSVIQFVGKVAECTTTRTETRLAVHSQLELLNVKLPRNLYQPGCMNTLFDTGCGLVKSSFGVAAFVGASSTRMSLNCGLAQADGWFDLGTLTFSSGPNAGIKRSVKRYQVGVLQLSYPLPRQPTVGDSFTVYPGCDKQQSTCQNKYANLARYRATPYIPEPEVAL